MYSPKIREELIPILYKIAAAKKIPMTRLVDQIVTAYLNEKESTDSIRPMAEQSQEIDGP